MAAARGAVKSSSEPRPTWVFPTHRPAVRLPPTRSARGVRTEKGGTTMFSRAVVFTGATDIDAGVRYLQDAVAPLLREQTGFRGVTASADRSAGVLGVLSLWETGADRDASESTLVKAREEGQRVIGGAMTVAQFEELLVETDKPP